MTLHGHTRIELTDVHTGAVEVVESDNLITNAVSDIFNGYGGSLNKAMLLWRGDQGYTNAPKDLKTKYYDGLLQNETPLSRNPTRRLAATRPPCCPRRALAVWARRWPGRSTRPKTRCAAAPT